MWIMSADKRKLINADNGKAIYLTYGGGVNVCIDKPNGYEHEKIATFSNVYDAQKYLAKLQKQLNKTPTVKRQARKPFI